MIYIETFNYNTIEYTSFYLCISQKIIQVFNENIQMAILTILVVSALTTIKLIDDTSELVTLVIFEPNLET